MDEPSEPFDQAPQETDAPDNAEESIDLSILHHGTTHTYTFPSTSVLTDLVEAITHELSIAAEHQKFLISPKVGMLKPPYPDPSLPLSTLVSKKIQLLAPTTSDLSSIAKPVDNRPRYKVKAAKPHRTRPDPQTLRDRAQYTFHEISPLPHLPEPARSRAFLERLRDDRGVQMAMARHKFSVGLLTELDPANLANTNRSGRTLGLNRNAGEVIELRLRTDADDGYRDYRGVRRTLCHELAHNLHSEHDRDFWELTKLLEKEVERDSWTTGGKALGGQDVYVPPEERENVDGGGWSGKGYVLGGGEVGPSGSGVLVTEGMSPRELVARAAEERMRQAGGGSGGGGTERKR